MGPIKMSLIICPKFESFLLYLKSIFFPLKIPSGAF